MNVWIHLRTGNKYVILDDNAEMKDSQSGEWEPAVIYETFDLAGSGVHRRYCRAKHLFRLKFSKMEEPSL